MTPTMDDQKPMTHEVIMCPVCLTQDVSPLDSPRLGSMYHRCPENLAKWNEWPDSKPEPFRWTGEKVHRDTR